KRLWPDTFVDVERNLNTAVNKIRGGVGGSAEGPRFVETLPRRGDRVICGGEGLVPAGGTAVEAELADGAARRQRWWKIGAGVLAILVIALGVLVAYRWHRPQPSHEHVVLTAVPFTALPGVASSPAFSPDGSRIAFAWSSQPGVHGFGEHDLYV